MGEVVNVIVAFAVIVFLVRWATSGSDSSERSAADTLGFRPKAVTQDMIDTISSMFPDIPVDNIRYDLLRTGNVEMTSNKILEKGFLEAPPPAYYTLYPRGEARQPTTAPRATTNRTGSTPAIITGIKPPRENLISRYGLQDRITSQPPAVAVIPEQGVDAKAVWEDSPEKREASLRERKAQMILAARQRMLAQQQQKKEAEVSLSKS